MRSSSWSASHKVLAFVPVALIAIASCDGPGTPSTYTVTGTLSNTPDLPLVRTLTIGYNGRASTGPRLVSDESLGLTYLATANLSLARTGFPSTDAYFLQVMSQPSAYISGDNQTTDAGISRAGNWVWMEPHTSDLFVLALQPSGVDDPTTVSAPNLDPRRTDAAAWLHVEEDDDFVLPYFVAPGSPGCTQFPPNSGDCLDVQTIAFTLLDGVVGGLRRTVDPASPGGPDPDPRLRVSGSPSTVSFIPNVVHGGLNTATRRIRGVGFVLQVRFEARAAGVTIRQPGVVNLPGGVRPPDSVDLGPPYHSVTVYVPIGLHFEDDGTGLLQITIDPIDLAGGIIGSDMAGRVAVEVGNPVGTPFDAAAGQAIATIAQAAVVEQLTARGPLADIASGLLAGFFNTLRQTRRLPANFDVVLIAGGGSQGVPASVILARGPGASGPRLVILE